MVQLKLISTSDVHGFLYPTNYSRPNDDQPYGWLRAATLLRQLQQPQNDAITLTIDAGDWIQGSAFASYFATQEPTQADLFAELLNAQHYEVGILGNHEFNYGLSYLRAAHSTRKYPLLAANIEGAYEQGVGDAPYQIIEKRGVKIAVLGLTTAHVPTWEPAQHVSGLTFHSALQTAKTWVPKLRALADVVVVAYHGGFEADLATGRPTEIVTDENEGYRLITQVPGIDALITGHQHRQLAGVYHGVPITQPGDKAVAVGVIDLTLDDTTHRVIDRHAQLLPTANCQPDSQMKAKTAAAEKRVQTWLDEPLGRLTGASMQISDPLAARIHHHPYLDFINRVEMRACHTDIAATALFNDDVLGFKPTVTRRQLLNSYPYPNTLVVEHVSGADLKAALERCAGFFTIDGQGNVILDSKSMTPKIELFNYDLYSGIDYTFDLKQPVGHRVEHLVYHGAAVQPTQLLDVAMNQYRGYGGGNYPMFTRTKIIREIHSTMADLIQRYLQTHTIVTGVAPTNLKIHI